MHRDLISISGTFLALAITALSAGYLYAHARRKNRWLAYQREQLRIISGAPELPSKGSGGRDRQFFRTRPKAV
jgi:hypothetical protein